MTYLPFVDGLRAVAILAVVAYHALPWALPGGFAGVDVFFVISGFLITRFIAAELADGSFSLLQFYIRRARRLLPAALACFLIVACVAAVVLLPDAYWYFGRSLLAALGMYANIFFYNTGGYFTAPSLEKPLLHTWSLAVEDQFYLTWPLLLVALAPRLSRRSLVVLGLVLAAASLYFAEVKISKDPEYAFFQLPARAWELLLGALLALTVPSWAMPKGLANGIAIAGGVAILASFALLSPDAHFPGFGALPACLGTAAIIAAGVHQNTVVSRALSWRPVVFVGLISYSLYLWHWPLIALASYWLEKPLGVLPAILAVIASFGLAVLSWRYVERPFRAGHREHTAAGLSAADRSFIFKIAVGAGVAVSVAMVLKLGKGFPQRYDAQVRTVLEQMVTGNPLRGSCDDFQNIFRNDGICNFGRKKAQTDSYEVALFGDSMADHWAPLVASFAEEHNLAGRQVTNGGCGLQFGTKIPAWPIAKSRECASYQAEAGKFIDANPGLKVAVISGFWEKWLGRTEHPDQRVDVPVATTDEEREGRSAPKFDQVLNDTIQVFSNRGIKVVLIGQIPTYKALPLRCIVGRLRYNADPSVCGMTRAEADAELIRSDQALLRAAKSWPNVSVSLPRTYMCQDQFCSPLLDGTMLYKNGGHVNQFGASLLRRFVEFPRLP